jgi:hypothetical protein
LSWEDQKYIVLNPSSVGSEERSTVTAGEVDVNYTPVKFVILKFSFRHERKTSNEYQFTYDDNLVFANVTLKF